jgi:hypothetical protein
LNRIPLLKDRGGEGNMLHQYLKLFDEENSDAVLYGISDITNLMLTNLKERGILNMK